MHRAVSLLEVYCSHHVEMNIFAYKLVPIRHSSNACSKFAVGIYACAYRIRTNHLMGAESSVSCKWLLPRWNDHSSSFIYESLTFPRRFEAKSLHPVLCRWVASFGLKM